MCATEQLGHGRSMDRVYRGQRHIYDLTRKYFLLGRDGLLADLSLPPGARICEIGCGTGRNLVKLARAQPEARLYGLDISAEMLKTAQAAVERAGLRDRIVLAHGAAESFDPENLFGVDEGFDIVFLSYTLSMIPDWRRALDQAFRVTRPGGRVLAVDFGDQRRLPRWFRKLLFAWLGHFSVTPRLELPETFRDLAACCDARAEIRAIHRGYGTALSARLPGP